MSSKRQSSQGGKPGDAGDATASNGITIALDDLMRKSKPIAVAKPSAPEKKLPAWGNPPLGASPTSQTRLQDIQVCSSYLLSSLSSAHTAVLDLLTDSLGLRDNEPYTIQIIALTADFSLLAYIDTYGVKARPKYKVTL